MEYFFQDIISIYEKARIFFVLLWIGATFVIGYYASNKGYSFLYWLIIALFFSPMFAGILVAGLKEISTENEDEKKKYFDKIYEKLNEISSMQKNIIENTKKQNSSLLHQDEEKITSIEKTENDIETFDKLKEIFETTDNENIKRESAEKLVKKGYLYYNRYLNKLS